MGFRDGVIAVSNLRKNWNALTTKMDEMTALSSDLMIDDACMKSKSKQAKTVVRWYYAVAKKRDEMVILSQEYNRHIDRSIFKRCYNLEETMNLSCKVSTFLKHVMELDALHSDAAEDFQKFNRNSMETFFNEMERRNPIRFTHAQLKSFTSNFSSRLGSGGFGEVFKGKLPTNSKMIAVKVLKIFNSNNEVKAQFMAEVGTIYTTHHRNLVQLYGYCFDTNMKAVVYEYMENGSLDKILFGKNQIMDWERLHGIAIGTAKGLSYLHDECHETIIHYDIKPGNILLDSNFCPKIADFGLAKLYDRGRSNVSVNEFRGTPGYAAPELWGQSSVVTCKCDVYSYGMMLFELVGRRRNLDATSSESQEWLPRLVWEKFEKGELDEFLAQYGLRERDGEEAKKMCKLALCCIQHVPTDRPSMSEVVKILEGDRDAMEPPNPFPHLFSPVVNINFILSSIEGSTTNNGGSKQANSQHFTPYEMVWDRIQ